MQACASPPQTATSVLNEGNQARFLAVIGDQRYNPLEGDHRSSIHCLHKCNLQKKLLGSRKTAGWARPFNELAEVFSQNVQSLHSSLRMLGWSYSGEDLDPIKLGLWDSDRVTTVGALSLPIIIGLFGELDLWGLYRWSPITARKRAWFPSFSTEVAVWGGDAQART